MRLLPPLMKLAFFGLTRELANTYNAGTTGKRHEGTIEHMHTVAVPAKRQGEKIVRRMRTEPSPSVTVGLYTADPGLPERQYLDPLGEPRVQPEPSWRVSRMASTAYLGLHAPHRARSMPRRPLRYPPPGWQVPWRRILPSLPRRD